MTAGSALNVDNLSPLRKWQAAGFDVKSLGVFRTHYPKGRNFVVTPDTREPYVRKIGDLSVQFAHLAGLRRLLEE
jgi:hypothetical protein